MAAKIRTPFEAAHRSGRVPLFALALLALLIAIAVGVLWKSTSEPRAAAAPAAIAGEAPSAPELTTPATTERAEQVFESEPAPEPESEAEPALDRELALPAPLLLTGAAIRIDPTGAEHAGDDGILSLVVHSSGAHETREIPVLAGRFNLSAPPDATLMVRALTLAGRLIHIDPPERAIPEDRFLVLRGSGLADVLLHVVSAQDGVELGGVDLFAAEGPMFTKMRRHPGVEPSIDALVRDGQSPVSVVPRGASFWTIRAYFVRAHGHAWETVSLDHEAGGERTVVLQPAAALEVELVGLQEWVCPLVKLWPPDAGPRRTYAIAEREPDAEGRAVFESLAPGRYSVSAERGWADDRMPFGETTVEVTAGERARVLLSLELPEEPRPVRVSGALVIEGGWNKHGLGLVFDAQGTASVWADKELRVGLGDMQYTDTGRAARFEWSLEFPVAGNYELAVKPLTVRQLLEVPAGGLEGVEVIVPAPADVRVLLHDSESREPVEVERLYWSPPRVEGVLGTPLLPVAIDTTTGEFAFRAPAGQISISPADPSLEFAGGELFDVEPGHNSIRIGVRRHIGVKFQMRDGDTTLPWSWEWRLRAQRVGGGARDVARSIGMLWFEEPGTYELYADEGIPGYASIDGTIFEVRPLTEGEEALEVVVPLEPDEGR